MKVRMRPGKTVVSEPYGTNKKKLGTSIDKRPCEVLQRKELVKKLLLPRLPFMGKRK